MAAPSVSGITKLWTQSDGDWTPEITAGAGAAIPFARVGANTRGINGVSNTLRVEGANVSVTEELHHSSHYIFATAGNGVDISGVNQFITFHAASPSGFSRLSADADSVRVVVFSGGSTADWAYWDLGGLGDDIYKQDGIWKLVAVGLIAPTNTGGSYDNTDITGLGLQHKFQSTGTFNFSHTFDQFLHVNDRLILTGGEIANPGGLDALFEIVKADSLSDIRSLLLRRAGIGYESYVAISFETDYAVTSTRSLSFVVADDVGQVYPVGFYWLNFAAKLAGSFRITSALLATATTAKYALDIDETGGTVELASTLFEDVSTMTLNGGDLEGATIFGNSLPVDVLVAPRGAWTLDASLNGGVEIIGGPGDYSALACTLGLNIVGDEITVGSVGAGNYNLTGVAALGSINVHNPSLTNAITVQLNPNVLATSSTAGGPIVIDNLVTYDLSATIPVGVSGLFLIHDVDRADPQDLGTELQRVVDASGIQTYTYSSAKAADEIAISFYAAGYKRYIERVTLSSSDFPFTLNLIPETN
jgi:hypothetical protein